MSDEVDEQILTALANNAAESWRALIGALDRLLSWRDEQTDTTPP